MENQIQKIIQTSGLQPAQAKPLLDSFGNYFVEAHKLATKGKAIKVTDISQIVEMQQARTIRLQLAKLRVDADKTRVSLKEGYLRGGNAVQAIYNDIRDIIKPEEDRLYEQEKFKENYEAKILAEKDADRIEKLSMYVEDVSMYNLKGMSDEVFAKLLEDQKSAFKARFEAEKKEEEDRLAQIEADRKEQERIRFENEKLRKEAQERERLTAIENEKREKELAKERAEQQKKLDTERKAKEQLEAKLKADKDAQDAKDREARAKADAEQKQKEEEERAKLLAPDKIKLIDLATEIDKIILPAVKSNEAGQVIQATKKMIENITNYLRQESKKL